MDRETLLARVRQLQALDINAAAIYSDLAVVMRDNSQREVFFNIADDERRHVALDKEMLSLLER